MACDHKPMMRRKRPGLLASFGNPLVPSYKFGPHYRSDETSYKPTSGPECVSVCPRLEWKTDLCCLGKQSGRMRMQHDVPCPISLLAAFLLDNYGIPLSFRVPVPGLCPWLSYYGQGAAPKPFPQMGPTRPLSQSDRRRESRSPVSRRKNARLT